MYMNLIKGFDLIVSFILSNINFRHDTRIRIYVLLILWQTLCNVIKLELRLGNGVITVLLPLSSFTGGHSSTQTPSTHLLKEPITSLVIIPLQDDSWSAAHLHLDFLLSSWKRGKANLMHSFTTYAHQRCVCVSVCMFVCPCVLVSVQICVRPYLSLLWLTQVAVL